jgi:hypothetical protein
MSNSGKQHSIRIALRGDFLSGRHDFMDHWDKLQGGIGADRSLDLLLDYLGGKKALKYFKYITQTHKINIDYDSVPSFKYKEIADLIERKSKYGARRLGDALIKAMSVEELEDALKYVEKQGKKDARSDRRGQPRKESSAESSFFDDLVKIGNRNPSLRDHISPILREIKGS